MSDNPRPLDETLYSLDEDEIQLLKSKTGITNDDELRKHVMKVQADIYAALLRLGQERPGALFLDMACCVGNDVRKAIADGFPMNQALASDLHPGKSAFTTPPKTNWPYIMTIIEFWAAGHQLFNTTQETFPVPFIPGDAFDPAFLKPSPIPGVKPSEPLPPLATLTSLTPLIGRLSAVHASSFFHLFPEDKQLQLARLLAPLLSPEPGSMLFGAHGGLSQKGLRERQNSHGVPMFCHSPESWKDLWETQIFSPGQVRVDAFLQQRIRKDLPAESRSFFLVWSVTRLW
ncbi:hypothetical protein EIP86_002707 [Pleurotus ostreatoroseus]|nr:hypothetical protein EIP86_002707 [Pleurotus ostreatoroseus]